MFGKNTALPRILVLVFLLLLIAAAFPGCTPEETSHDDNGPQAGPGNGVEPPPDDPAEPDDPPKPDEPPRPEETLQKSELSTIELELEAFNLSFSPDGNYFVYEQPAQVDSIGLSDIEGNDYSLLADSSESDRSFSKGGAVWHGEKLYYLVVFDVLDYELTENEMAVYVCNTASKSVTPQLLLEETFARSLRPMLPVDGGERILFVSGEGVFEYRVSDQDWRQIAELPRDIYRNLAWNPAGTHLAYIENGRLGLIDLANETASYLHEPEGEAYEFSWSDDGSKIAVLSGSSPKILDIVSIEGEVTHSLTLANKSIFSLCWVPGQEMVSYLERDIWIPSKYDKTDSQEPIKLVIEVLGEGIRIVDEDARNYAWVSQNKLCYYDEPGEGDTTLVSFYEISW